MSEAVQEFIFNMFGLFGGFGMFIYGMHIMAEGLQKSAGSKMKNLLGALTNNRLLAVIVGALVTAVIQSSSASTVMVVGFVNAGLMNLVQAVGVIMGANIGTTITSWIVSLDEIFVFFKPSKIAPLIVGIGACLLFFSKDKKKKQIGEILVGFSLIFIGLDMMKHGITPYKDSQVFKDAFVSLGSNPVLGIFAGFAVTAIIQSSSASVGILQALAVTGAIPFSAAVYIILGQNIGTTVTAMLSSIGANINAKRAAVIHLLFNVIGSVTFAVVMTVYFSFNKELATGVIDKVGISTFHTVFNVSCTILMFGFAKHLVTIAEKLVPGKADESYETEGEIALRHLDERILETPAFAVENVVKEVVHVGELAKDNVKLAMEALFEADMYKVKEVLKVENDINKLEKVVTKYIVKLSNTNLDTKQHALITNLFHTINDVERVGDHAENIADLATFYHENQLSFSKRAVSELEEISSITIDSLEKALHSRLNSLPEIYEEVSEMETKIDVMETQMRESHIKRLSHNQCDPSTGVVFLDVISNLERVSDHALNIVGFVRDESVK